MKLKRIICAALAACLLVGGADAMAQKRKSTARKATGKTAVAKKSTTSRAVTGPALDASKLTGVEYFGFINWKSPQLKGLWVGQTLTLESDDFTWNVSGRDLGGTWSVAGNSLEITSRAMKLRMKSPDGGIYFTGKFDIGSDTNHDCFLYRETNFTTPVDTAALKKRILDGKYTAFVSMYSNGQPEFGAPAKIKLVPGNNSDEGTYKITVEHEIMAGALGIMKGTYKFDENGFHMTNFNGKDIWWKYENMNCAVQYIKLGDKSIQGYGSQAIYAYFFFK